MTSARAQDVGHEANTANRARGYALVLATLTALFAGRVIAQVLQRGSPVSWLPPFEAFQGSDLPYAVLLTSQLVLLALMVGVTLRVAVRPQRAHALVARVLAWVGGLYMGGSLARIVLGLTLNDAPPWFTAWISAVFHLVLAAFVLTLAAYYNAPRRPSVAVNEETLP
jgi:hypothetical protein